jgi:hypothetical protein
MTHTKEQAISTLGGNPSKAKIAKEIKRLDANTIIDTIRYDRNERLSRCDWRFLADQVPSDEWREYRQALRDVTKDIDIDTILSTGQITWPVSPDELSPEENM